MLRSIEWSLPKRNVLCKIGNKGGMRTQNYNFNCGCKIVSYTVPCKGAAGQARATSDDPDRVVMTYRVIGGHQISHHTSILRGSPISTTPVDRVDIVVGVDLMLAFSNEPERLKIKQIIN